MRPTRILSLRKPALAIFMVFILASVGLVYAQAEPEGPDTPIQVTQNNRRLAAPAPTLAAEAGNISHIILSGQTVTQSWQGFVGNITGTITLDDALNNTLYNWTLADPEGEVYATYIDNVSWLTGDVGCWNWTQAATGGAETYLQIGELAGWDSTFGTGPNPVAYGAQMGQAIDDVDAINATFSMTNTHSSFYVGGQVIPDITGHRCPNMRLFNSTGAAGGDDEFEEVLLYHTGGGQVNQSGVIYTAILESNRAGYDGSPWDFQMIVGDDGHNGNTTATTYYFYVEIE